MLKWGIRQKLFRDDLDPELASLLMSGAYDRVARHVVRSDVKPRLAAMLAELQRLLVRGFATPALTAIIDREVNNVARRNGTGRSGIPPAPLKRRSRSR